MLANVEEDTQIMKIIQQRHHHWTGRILRHQSLMLEIIKRQMKRDLKEDKRMQMLHLYVAYITDIGYVVALK